MEGNHHGEYFRETCKIRSPIYGRFSYTIHLHFPTFVNLHSFIVLFLVLDVARRLLIAGIANFPHSKNIGWFHAALASLSRQDGDLFTARACYSRAILATPPQLSLQVLLDFAKMEAYLGDRNEAVKLFETAVKRFPTHDRSVCVCERERVKEIEIERRR